MENTGFNEEKIPVGKKTEAATEKANPKTKNL